MRQKMVGSAHPTELDVQEITFIPQSTKTLTAEELLFGPDARLGLDSLDALQVSMALQKRYRVRLVDSKETRRILSCVGNLADHLLQQKLV